MASLRRMAIIAIIFLSVASATTYAQFHSGWTCITFDNKPAGRRYLVGDGDQFSGMYVEFVGFKGDYGDTNDPTTVHGFAGVDRIGRWGGVIGGSGHDIQTSNISLSIHIPRGTSHLTVRYGDWGGNINVGINKEFRSYNDFSDIDSKSPFTDVRMKVGVTRMRSYHYGELEFTPSETTDQINHLIIGGQELVLDDICLLNNRVVGPDSKAVQMLDTLKQQIDKLTEEIRALRDQIEVLKEQ